MFATIMIIRHQCSKIGPAFPARSCHRCFTTFSMTSSHPDTSLRDRKCIKPAFYAAYWHCPLPAADTHAKNLRKTVTKVLRNGILSDRYKIRSIFVTVVQIKHSTRSGYSFNNDNCLFLPEELGNFAF